MESLLVHPKDKEQLDALKAVMKALKVEYRDIKDTVYNEDFVAKMERGENQFSNGEYTNYSQ